MSQDEQKRDPRDENTPGHDGLEERGFTDEAPDPERDGRIPDQDQPEDPSGEESGEAGPGVANHSGDPAAEAPDTVPPYEYDEDGNLTGSSMVEPGDKASDDGAVRAEDPYRVEPYSDTEEPYSYDYYDESYADTSKDVVTTDAAAPAVAASTGGPTEPPGGDDADDEDDDDEGMLRMSFMEHLEELRSRLLKIVGGLALAFAVSVVFSPDLWRIVQQPAERALTELGIDPPSLTQIKPMEAFNVVYIKLPLIAALFLASPWILYQVWAFISPGLYKRERKWAGPFVIGSAGLFIVGGLFAYFVAFRFGLTFLLGIGRDINITPMVSISEYFDLFVNVVLAISLVFELPVLIFFLTLLRIVNPGFLVRNSRYAILGIVVLAAVITPTPDIFNLMIFSVPMIVLFFVGVLLSYVLVLHQEGRRFPWHVFFWTLGGLVAIAAGVLAIAIFYYGYRWQWVWPFLIQ